ncbi:hypothetical protein ACIBPB_33310 [Micromonospora sp. NPDC049836]|uniref:hypothetical protein n=1 Tax=Micromonospora sp. NPDC049836 TaxID=3364274 RepID=UPI0037A7BF0D
MQLGFVIPVVGPAVSDAPALSAFVRGLEDLDRGPQMTRFLDPMLLLTVAAAATSRVRLNTSTLSTFYYEPPRGRMLDDMLAFLQAWWTTSPLPWDSCVDQ